MVSSIEDSKCKYFLNYLYNTKELMGVPIFTFFSNTMTN